MTEKAIKRARREHEHQFKRKGTLEQFVFNESIVDKIKSAKHQLILAQHGGTSTATTEKMVQVIKERLAFTEEGQELIKLADRSDTSWLVVADYQEDELVEHMAQLPHTKQGPIGIIS